MAKFIRKEANVEAMQFTGDVKAAEDFVGRKLQNAGQVMGQRQALPDKNGIMRRVEGAEDMPGGVVVGKHACIEGDWIVKTKSGLAVMSERQYKHLNDEAGK
jgi:hypothetical protein